jgi:GNAT superfamily N-acetyltransferase
LKRSLKIRSATEEDVPVISESIEEWLRWSVPRKQSIKRAVRNKELLVADLEGQVEGFIHYVPHEDIIDGGLNFFITCLYVSPERRAEGVGSALLDAVIKDAVDRGALGVETSTANPDARRLYERHGFRQFKGGWTMGEVFLELDMKKYISENREARNQGKVNRVRVS